MRPQNALNIWGILTIEVNGGDEGIRTLETIPRLLP